MSTAEPMVYTPEDLLNMPDGKHFELSEGELREVEMGAESEWIALELGHLLICATRRPRIGWVFGSTTGCQCFPDAAGKVRKPDASFIKLGRLPDETIPKGHIRIAPDLAVEVVSPHDLYSEVTVKVDEYLAAGVLLVWVIDPETRSVSVSRKDGSTVVLRDHETLNGEDLIPEFSCSVTDLFPPSNLQST